MIYFSKVISKRIQMLDMCEMLLQALSLLSLRGRLDGSQLSALSDAIYAQSVICNTTTMR